MLKTSTKYFYSNISLLLDQITDYNNLAKLTYKTKHYNPSPVNLASIHIFLNCF